MNRLRQIAVALALLVVSAMPVLAQSLTGSIAGVVKDEQGGALPGVTVTLAGRTGARTTVTEADGSYRFAAVESGTYELRFELAGFQSRKEENVVMTISKQLTADVGLRVAGKTETIEVVGAAPVVDVSSTQSTNSLSQDLLYNMPLVRFAPDLLNYAPGINSGSAFGGGSTAGGGGTGNALLIDGVDTRDPEGGTAWSFFNYNAVEEVQIQGLGAPAEYGAYTGAIVNTITKSGGNLFSGLFDVNYSRASFASRNVSSAIAEVNPTLQPNITTNLLDWTAQVGGPLQQDKLFFFLSTQRYHLKLDPPGPRTLRDELSHRLNMKLTWQPTPNDNGIVHVEYDDYSVHGRPGFDSTIDTNFQTVAESAPEWVWNAQWRHLFGSKTFLEAKYLGWWGYYYLDPESPGARYYDATVSNYEPQPEGTAFAGLPSSAGNFYYADRGRHEGHLALSHYAEAFGHHDMKFGVQVERSRVRNRYGYPTGVNFYDLSSSYPVGQYYAYTYGYDVSGRNHRESVYAQDSWKPSARLTVNGGLRLDRIHGLGDSRNNVGEVYTSSSWAPRIGFAWDVSGDHSAVVKAHYGQYYEAAFFTLYERALPGRQDFVGLCYDGESQEPGGPPGFAECNRVPFSAIYKVDPNLKHPRVDEVTVGFEKAFGSDFRFALTGILRDNKNTVDAVLPDARFERVTISPDQDAVPVNSIDLFRWVNRTSSQENGLITNVDGWQYLDSSGNTIATARAHRRYKGLMFVLSKRLTNRWQGQVSYVLSKTTGTADNRGFGAATGNSNFWKTPNTSVLNSDGFVGYDRRHEVKVFASYEVPVAEIGVNAYFSHLSGIPYNAVYRLNSADRKATGFASSPSSMRSILLEPLGSRRYDAQNILSLRLEKIFKLGAAKERLSVYADINNVFNSGTIDDRVTRTTGISLGSPSVTVPYEGALSVIDPRQITLGARWSF
jgi:hypothetical protein